MATINRNDKTKRYEGGSSLLQLGLTAEQAQAALGDAEAVAGWYTVSYLEGGTIGREVNATQDYDESGEHLGTITEQDQFVVVNTAKQTDAQTLKLLAWWEKNSVPVRYPLPAGDGWQMHYHPSMRKDVANETLPTTRGLRTFQFTARGKKADHVFEDVDGIDATAQAEWPDSLAGAKDTVFNGA